jgi:signal transduction histidine kinase
MKRLIRLVNMIMKYEQFDNKTLKIEKHNKDLWILTKKVVSQYENSLLQNNQNIRIIWTTTKKVDKNLFKQIVHNIIGNFMKYAGKNSNLEIIFTEEYAIFKDDGMWVDRKEVPLLKEKFYQAKIEKTWKLEDRWIWVGLSIVAKIIERHWWDFEIISDTSKWFILKIIF